MPFIRSEFQANDIIAQNQEFYFSHVAYNIGIDV